jgi:hypothetical protein
MQKLLEFYLTKTNTCKEIQNNGQIFFLSSPLLLFVVFYKGIGYFLVGSETTLGLGLSLIVIQGLLQLPG